MTQVIKLRAPFDRLRSYNITPEVALQKAIVLQAVIDASTSPSSKKINI